MIGELLYDRPAFTSCELLAHPELVRDRGVPLVVRGVSSVDGDLHCTVTSCGAALRAATSRSNHSRAAWRARMRTTTRSGSSRRSCAALRGVPRRVRRWRFARDRIITPLLPPSGRSVRRRLSTSAVRPMGHHVIAGDSAQPRPCQARSRVSGRSEAEWLDWAEDRRTIRCRDGRIGWPPGRSA